GYCVCVELPFGPWQATQAAALACAAGCAVVSAGSRAAPQTSSRRKSIVWVIACRWARQQKTRHLACRARVTESNSRDREHEYRVAALEVELRVAAGGYRHILFAFDHVAHRGCIDAGSALEFPQFLAAGRVEGAEPAVALAVEH